MGWKKDKSLELKFNYDAFFCRKLKLVSENIFSLDFETYVNFYKTLGEYEIETEFFSEGRPVYRRVDGKEAVFLMVPERSPHLRESLHCERQRNAEPNGCWTIATLLTSFSKRLPDKSFQGCSN